MIEYKTSSAITIAKCFFIVLFILLSLVGNTGVLLVIRLYKNLRTIPNCFIASLAVADLLYAIFGTTALVVTAAADKWVFGDTYCNFIGVTNTWFCTASIWTLVAISINRYLALTKSLKLQVFTYKKVFSMLLGIWILSLTLSLAPLLGWNRIIIGTNYCLFDGMYETSYPFVLISLDFVVPAVALPIFYFKIFSYIKRHQRKMSHITYRFSSKPFLNSSNTVTTIKHSPNIFDQMQISETRREIRVTFMLLVVVITFYICWIPFLIGSILYVFDTESRNFDLLTFGIVVASMNGAINPFIYAILGNNFRKAFKDISYKFFRCFCFRRIHPSPC